MKKGKANDPSPVFTYRHIVVKYKDVKFRSMACPRCN